MKIRGGGSDGPEYLVPENEYEADDIDRTAVQCRSCLRDVDDCHCLISCCPECGGPRVWVSTIEKCPGCDRGKESLHSRAKEAREFAAFDDPEDEPTKDIPKDWKP